MTSDTAMHAMTGDTAMHAMTGDKGVAAAAHALVAQSDKPHGTSASSPATEHTVVSEPADIVRNNEEYMLVYRTIEALKGQLSRAKSDMDILVSLREQALARPLEYVESLVSGAAPKAPPRQDVVDVPLVDAEAYFVCASPASVAKYAHYTQSPAARTRHASAGTSVDVALRSKPVRPSALRSSAPAHAKQAKRGGPRQPPTASVGQLTGRTAVATPEHSPPRLRDDHYKQVAVSMRTAPADGANGNVDGDYGSRPAAPRVARANTEPARPAPSPHGGDRDTPHARTLPGTPTRGGKSQKMYTPQMLAELRQQASDDEPQPFEDRQAWGGSSRSDENGGLRHGGLAESSFSAPPLGAVAPAEGDRHSGKSLLFSDISLTAPGSGSGSGSCANAPGSAQPVPAKTPRPKTAGGHAKAKATTKKKGRGPTRDDEDRPKPPSYNLPWSDEEQTRLEELLVEFPEEEVANDRWRRISEALGTRTMRQVASRVQKYFIKLAKAGLPVPGRAPDTSGWTSIGRGGMAMPTREASEAAGMAGTGGHAVGRGSAAGRRKRKHVDFTSSEEDEDEVDIDLDGHSDDDDHDPFAGDAARPPVDRKGKQVDWLGGGADDSGSGAFGMGEPDVGPSTSSAHLQTPALRSAKAVHLGYQCDSCLAEPIVGIRWHCLECRGAFTVDLCDECREEGTFETERHRDTHSFQARREAEMEPYYANEVASMALREYSYLA